MLLEFAVENFRSIKDKQTLSLLADTSKEELPDNVLDVSEKLQVLKSAIIYGANASGKSNVMRAFHAFWMLVSFSADHNPGDSLKEYEPFQFNPATKSAPTSFELTLLIDDTRYFYAVSILEKQILHEKLLFYPQGREARLFIREGQHFDFGDYLKGQKTVIAELTTENQLFLSKAAKNNLKQLVEVYIFLNQHLMPIPFMDSWIDSYYMNRIARELVSSKQDTRFFHNFKALLQSFDTGIVDFRIEERDALSEKREFEIYADHIVFDEQGRETGTVFQSFSEESAGTQKLFVLGGLILRALMNGRTIMIDEFERSLHPMISSYIIQLFHHPRINVKGAQLILATHDTNLLSKDNQLRRDQIWIIEKDKTGASELFSLADITGVPSRAPFEKWYLSGRFGGVPGIERLHFEFGYQHDEA